MKKVITFILCYLIFLQLSHGNIAKINIDPKSKSSSQTLDPIISAPFELQRNSVYSKLPDSLGGKKINGLAILKLNIGKNGRIKSFMISRITLYKGNKCIVNYWAGDKLLTNKKQYPSDVARYYFFLEQYAYNQRVIRRHSMKLEQNNYMYFLVRF